MSYTHHIRRLGIMSVIFYCGYQNLTAYNQCSRNCKYPLSLIAHQLPYMRIHDSQCSRNCKYPLLIDYLLPYIRSHTDISQTDFIIECYFALQSIHKPQILDESCHDILAKFTPTNTTTNNTKNQQSIHINTYINKESKRLKSTNESTDILQRQFTTAFQHDDEDTKEGVLFSACLSDKPQSPDEPNAESNTDNANIGDGTHFGDEIAGYTEHDGTNSNNSDNIEQLCDNGTIMTNARSSALLLVAPYLISTSPTAISPSTSVENSKHNKYENNPDVSKSTIPISKQTDTQYNEGDGSVEKEIVFYEDPDLGLATYADTDRGWMTFANISDQQLYTKLLPFIGQTIFDHYKVIKCTCDNIDSIELFDNKRHISVGFSQSHIQFNIERSANDVNPNAVNLIISDNKMNSSESRSQYGIGNPISDTTEPLKHYNFVMKLIHNINNLSASTDTVGHKPILQDTTVDQTTSSKVCESPKLYSTSSSSNEIPDKNIK